MTIDDKISEIEHRLRTEVEELHLQDYHETFHLQCCEFVKNEGLWLEFGIFTGRSIEQFSRKCPHDIFGFDCFAGLPEKWDDQNPQHCYSLGGNVPAGYIVGENHSMFDKNHPTNILPWPKNVKLVPGYFNDTLPKFTQIYKDPVAFLHIDSDLYSSAKTVFDNLKSQIVKGTIILFDEIVGYGDYKNHEIKAFAEFLMETGLDYTPLLAQNLGNYGQGLFEII